MQPTQLEPTKPGDSSAPGNRCSVVWLRYWLPVFLWMTMIFIASTDLLSGQRTSRFLGPFLRWLVPGITENSIGLVQFVVRKCGHVSEYAVLAVLLWRARLKAIAPAGAAFPVTQAITVVVLCCAYSISDEFHQHFVPSRDASIRDVILDTCGASLGVAVVWALSRRARKQ